MYVLPYLNIGILYILVYDLAKTNTFFTDINFQFVQIHLLSAASTAPSM